MTQSDRLFRLSRTFNPPPFSRPSPLQIYEVCERNGRIAYRRAGGSRLITSNDHWKSQVRHALYTGDRFRRVSSNSEFWQLTPPHVDNGAELMKVLVRADDPTCSTVAASSQPPSPGRVRSVPGLAKARPSVPPSRRASRLRRKRGSRGDGGSDEDLAEEVSAEAICDSADPGVLGSKTRSVRGVGNIAEGSADHSTQEWDDKVHELPRLRATRTAGRQQAFSFQTPAAQGSPATANRMLSRTVGQRGSGNISRSSDDPSTVSANCNAVPCNTICATPVDSLASTPHACACPPAAALGLHCTAQLHHHCRRQLAVCREDARRTCPAHLATRPCPVR